MLASSTTLGCGLSLYLAFWTTEPQAAEPPPAKVYNLSGWTMVIQPGPTAAKPVAALKAPATETVSTPDRPPSPAIRLASFSAQLPMPPSPEITAVDRAPALPESSAEAPCVIAPAARVKDYRSVYDAIPFSRAEYDANPSYRHDATMEFLFGQLRPTVIQRGHTTVTVQQSGDGGLDWSPYVYYGRSGWYAPYPAPGYRVFRGW